MRKALGIILSFAFIVFTIILLIALNFKFTFLSSSRIKSFANRSNIYETTAASLREMFVKASGSQIDDGPMLEIISETYTPSAIRNVSESTIDQFFALLRDPKANPHIVISFSPIENKLRNLLTEKVGYVPSETEIANISPLVQKDIVLERLDQNPYIIHLANTQIYLILAAALVLVLLVILFFTTAKNNSQGFVWLGSTFILLSLALTGLTLALHYLLPPLLLQLASQYTLGDLKIKSSVEKIIKLLIDQQQTFLIIESSCSFLLGLFLLWFGRGIKEERIELIHSLSR